MYENSLESSTKIDLNPMVLCKEVSAHYLNCNTVGGRNPAPVDMVNISLSRRFYTCQVVQGFFHQQFPFKKSKVMTFEKIDPVVKHLGLHQFDTLKKHSRENINVANKKLTSPKPERDRCTPGMEQHIYK